MVVSLYGAEDTFAIAVVPAGKKLDLKAFAEVGGSKKASMTEAKEAERITGYVLGGISPLGQKKRLSTIIDKSALEHDTIYVSAGRRGLEIQLDPQDLIRLCNARIANIKR